MSLGRSVPACLMALLPLAAIAQPCTRVVYLTFDTGNMRHAEAIAATLRRHDVKATFFLANEKTARGDDALDAAWAGYWKQLAAEGHAFGSHTFDHVYFRGEQKAADGSVLALARPQFGREAGRTLRWDGAALARYAALADAVRAAVLVRVWLRRRDNPVGGAFG